MRYHLDTANGLPGLHRAASAGSSELAYLDGSIHHSHRGVWGYPVTRLIPRLIRRANRDNLFSANKVRCLTEFYIIRDVRIIHMVRETRIMRNTRWVNCL